MGALDQAGGVEDAVAVPPASATSTVPSGSEPSENVTVPLGLTAALPAGVMVA